MKGLRAIPEFEELVLHPLRWGDDSMMQLGNIYSGALFAWLAAGFEEAARAGEDWAGDEILLIGYGSGDAAEALPMRVMRRLEGGGRAYSLQQGAGAGLRPQPQSIRGAARRICSG